MQTWVMVLYTNSKLSEREILKKNLIYNPLKKNKLPVNKFNQGSERPVHWQSDINEKY